MEQKKKKRSGRAQSPAQQSEAVHFVVPRPGKHNWKEPSKDIALKRLHKFTYRAGDLALEEYQAQFLMQREYFID